METLRHYIPGLAKAHDTASLIWVLVGWAGNITFTSRFFLQWYVTEKRKQVSIPVAFWWLSLVGALIMLVYSLFFVRDPVIIFAYALGWIPYTRNLVFHYRHLREQKTCPECQTLAPAAANFCSRCGASLSQAAGAAKV